MKVYAFDVDDTLNGFGGPIPLYTLCDLKNAGHIVGICGNWQVFCSSVSDWHQYISFLSVGLAKDSWLSHFKEMLPQYEDYILVGNRAGVTGASDDEGAAKRSGWRFIGEREFANGER